MCLIFVNGLDYKIYLILEISQITVYIFIIQERDFKNYTH